MVSDASEVYKFWTDELKITFGENSAEWLEAMNYRLGFAKEYTSYMRSAESEFLRADIHPTSTKQRIQILHSLGALLPEKRDVVLKRIDTTLANIPKSALTAHLYLEATSLFERMQLPERSIECQNLALNSLCERLPGNLLWLQEYIEKLRLTLSADRPIRRLESELTMALDRLSDAGPIPVERTVLSSLELDGQFGYAMDLLKIIIAKESPSNVTRSNVELLSRDYSSLAGILSQKTLKRHEPPNIDFVGQFDCLLLQPRVQQAVNSLFKWDSSGIYFEVQGDQIKNVIAVDPSREVPDYTQNLLTHIRPLVSHLHERRDLLFKAVPDGKSKIIVLSVKLQNGTWFTPKYSGELDKHF
jgi:hypothetical protein